MNFAPISELSIVTVFDRGIPNKECVAISVVEPCNLGSYALTAGMRAPEDMVYPVRDLFLWLGEMEVIPGDWIFIYTGPGSGQVRPSPNGENTSYTAHWGRKSIVFTTPQVIPVLFRLDSIAMGMENTKVLTAQPTQTALANLVSIDSPLRGRVTFTPPDYLPRRR